MFYLPPSFLVIFFVIKKFFRGELPSSFFNLVFLAIILNQNSTKYPPQFRHTAKISTIV